MISGRSKGEGVYEIHHYWGFGKSCGSSPIVAPPAPSPNTAALSSSRSSPSADIDQHAGSLDSLLALARTDAEERGLEDAPWPPHFAKQPGEPKRVQPSRARSDV